VQLGTPGRQDMVAIPPLACCFTSHRQALQRKGLEITESAAIDDDAADAVDTLERLRGLGYRLALDDFGVGFSNIVRLQQLHPSILKIDRSLMVRAGLGEPGAVEVLAWAVSIGRILGARTIVEGVESCEHEAILRSVGADLCQGYWYGRPMPVDAWAASDLGRVDEAVAPSATSPEAHALHLHPAARGFVAPAQSRKARTS